MAETARGFAKILFGELASFATGVTDMVNMAREQGLGYRNTDMFRDANLALHSFQLGPLQREADPWAPLDRDLLIEHPFTNDRLYRHIGTAWYRDPETGERYERIVSFYSDMDADEFSLTEEYEYLNELSGSQPNWEVESFERSFTWHNRGREYQLGGVTTLKEL